MQQSVEYQIFIGLNDAQVYEEVVNEKELVEIVSNYFERKEIDFSMFKAKGGYCYDSDKFVIENTLCINIIGKTNQFFIDNSARWIHPRQRIYNRD